VKKDSFRRSEGGGFFAAGESFARALGLLSDGAFKVFAAICLRAGRESGKLDFRPSDLARQTGKSLRSLRRCLRELSIRGVCEVDPSPNQHRQSAVRVRPEFWPYEALAPKPPDPVESYVRKVREAFLRPACVQGEFGPADERLATAWHRAGTPVETVRRACLLGSVRKTMNLIDRPQDRPIHSLHYFEAVLDEVRTDSFPPGYWEHLELNLQLFERRLSGGPEAGARSNLAGQMPRATSEIPLPTSSQEERKEDDVGTPEP